MPTTMDKPSLTADYDDDFFLWTQQQAEALRHAARARINEPVDWENVAEEIESLGKRDRREIKSRIFQILLHLLNLRMSSRDEPREHWISELRAQRREISDLLQDSPSLRRCVPDFVAAQWSDAVDQAHLKLLSHGESRPSEAVLLKLKEGFDRDVLDPDFFPESIGQEQ
jgi:hypothetical protein